MIRWLPSTKNRTPVNRRLSTRDVASNPTCGLRVYIELGPEGNKSLGRFLVIFCIIISLST